MNDLMDIRRRAGLGETELDDPDALFDQERAISKQMEEKIRSVLDEFDVGIEQIWVDADSRRGNIEVHIDLYTHITVAQIAALMKAGLINEDTALSGDGMSGGVNLLTTVEYPQKFGS